MHYFTDMHSSKLLAASAAFIAFLFIYLICIKKNIEERKRRPPEPGGAWPVVGHLGLLSTTTPLHRTFAALSEKYGSVFSLRLGYMPVIVVSSMDLAKECLVTNDQAFADRPQLESSKRLGYNSAMLGFAPYGAYWRELRKITTINLLSTLRLELLKHIRVEEVDSLVRGLYNSCRSDKPVEMKSRLSSLTMNIIFRMVAGKRYFDVDGEENDEKANEFKKVIEELFYLDGVLTVSDAIPWLGWLDIGGHLKAMKRVQKKIDGISSAWVAEHRQKKCGREGVDRDFIDVLIEELEDGRLSKEHSTDIIIKATAMNMVEAGTDTTSGTLEWTLSLLLNNRHVLKNAYHELDSQVGKKRLVDESDIKNLTYLQAIVKESMRLYPVGPLLVPHQSTEAVQVGGFHIPAGTIMFVNVWKIQRDPIFWTEPEEFQPERFLMKNEETNFSGQSFAFMPFGVGRRMCPGSNMAMKVIHLVLARLLQSFELSAPMAEPIDMTERFGLTAPKIVPLKVHLKPRLPPHLY